jgi:outer membrane protein TolC
MMVRTSTVAFFVAAGLLAGCASPPPLAPALDEIARHQHTLPSDALAMPLTVDDAVSLAIRYNLDARVKAMEEALAVGKADLSLFAMLPQIAANGAISRRNPRNITKSKDLTTGAVSQSASTSEDAFRRTGDLTMSWNLVDFGIALIRSDQDEDRVEQAMEKRRRAIHLLVQDVQAAYWKAVINEYAERKYNALELKLIRSVQDAEEAERSRVGDPMQMLTHQRAIVDTMRQIAELQRQTATARADLSGLMGVPSPSSFQLAELDERSDLKVDDLSEPMDAMEGFALTHRPELGGEAAQFRIDLAEIHTEMLKSIPGIGPYIGGHFDSNSFMVYNSWADAGLKVAWNLVDLISAPKRIDQATAVVETTRARRLALSMAVLTQVHVASLQYRHALKEYRLTEKMGTIDDRITRLAGRSRQVGSGSPMEEIKAEAASMLSALRRFIIYSDLRGARARLDAALGIDPAPPTVQSDPVDPGMDNAG